METKIIIGIVLVLVILIAIVVWHSRKTTYKCPKCNKKFKISFLTDLISPHWIGDGSYKYLKCPGCKNRVKAKEVNK